MTKGGAILGIGNGERENTEPYGMPFTKRVGRLEEALTVIHMLWESRGEPVSFDGPTWKLRDALFTTPLYEGKPPALWVAAHAPRMLGLTGRFANGWFPTHKMSGEEYGAKLAVIRAAARAAGRSFDRFEPSLQIQVALGPGRRETIARLLRVKPVVSMTLLMPGATWRKHGLTHPLGEAFEGFPDIMPNEVSMDALQSAERQATPELFEDGVCAGTVDEVVAEVKPLVAAGLKHVVILNISPLGSGGGPGDLVRQTQLVWKLRKLVTAEAA